MVTSIKSTSIDTVLTPAIKLILNGVLFQVVWFACVLGGSLVGLAVTVAVLAAHALFVVRKNAEWIGIAAITLIGFLMDNLLAAFSVFQFQDTGLVFIPLWLICIWAGFASTILHSLFWLRNKLWLAALLGGFAGPASYFGGSKIASVALLDPVWFSLLPIALCWAVLMPVLLILMDRFVNEK